MTIYFQNNLNVRRTAAGTWDLYRDEQRLRALTDQEADMLTSVYAAGRNDAMKPIRQRSIDLFVAGFLAGAAACALITLPPRQ